MKSRGLYIIAFLFLLTSCDKFLEYKDQDKVIPNKLEHYNELIFGEILLKDCESALTNLSLMTDDVACFVKDQLSSYDSDSRDQYYGWYTWAIEPQKDKNGEDRPDKAWEFFYHKILMCNIIEHDVSEFEEDLEGVKKRLLGEVQFMRALSYFYLINLYGAPYENKTQAQTAMGVPINREIGIYDHLYTRSTLQQVYEQIEEDLLKAQQNLQEGEQKNTIFRPNVHVVNLLLSRVYLFQKRWDEAILLATEVITHSGAAIESINSLTSNEHLYYKGNPGILFSWGEGDRGTLVSDYYQAGRFTLSPDLKSKFIEGDQRAIGFFDSYSDYPNKFNGDEIYRRCLRIEEAYLNRAEAYIESGKEWEKGMEDINAIRINRIENNWKSPASTPGEAKEAYRLERRLELCFEEFRWFDIRRWGLEVVHRYENFRDNTSYQEFKLEANSPNYILPLPLDEQDVNTFIEKPVRVDCEIK